MATIPRTAAAVARSTQPDLLSTVILPGNRKRLPSGNSAGGSLKGEKAYLKKIGAAQAFLNSFRETGVVQLSCRAANIGFATIYDWKNTNREVKGEAEKDFRKWFRKEFEMAKEEANSALEGEVYRRAVVGNPRIVRDRHGKEVGTTRDYSDLLLIFLTKARMPERFRDNFGVNIGDTVNLTVNQSQVVNAIVGLPEEELIRLASRGRLLEGEVSGPSP